MPTITILGNLVRDPELRYTGSGKAVANLTVAENHRRPIADGQGWQDTKPTYWPVTVWGEHAEHLAQSVTAGARVVVLGRTGTRVWTPTEGERAGQQRRLEVVADEVAPSLRWATATLAKIEHRDSDAPVEDKPPF